MGVWVGGGGVWRVFGVDWCIFKVFVVGAVFCFVWCRISLIWCIFKNYGAEIWMSVKNFAFYWGSLDANMGKYAFKKNFYTFIFS